MKEYLLLFWNESGDNTYVLDPKQMETSMEAWKNWIGQIAMQGRLISTKPIQWEGSIVDHNAVHPRPAILEGQMVTGYLLCKANNREEVENWAATCPILASPKGATEIREVAPFEI